MTVVLRDMTGAHEAEQLRLAAGQAEASGLAKTQFLSRMSHEQRTPLNAVLGFSQLLQEAGKDKLDGRERRHLDLHATSERSLSTRIVHEGIRACSRVWPPPEWVRRARNATTRFVCGNCKCQRYNKNSCHGLVAGVIADNVNARASLASIGMPSYPIQKGAP